MIGKALRATTGVAALVGLAACDGGPAREAAPAAKVVTVSNPFHDGLVKLDELRRGAALRRAIRGAGESCNRVETAAFQQDHRNLKMWTATCKRQAYAVFLAPNGDVQVRPCADLARLDLPACRIDTPG